MLCYVMLCNTLSPKTADLTGMLSQVDPSVTTKGMKTFILGYENKCVFRTIIFFY